MKTLKNIIIGSAIIFALVYTLNLEYFVKGVRVVYLNGQTTVFIDDLKYFDYEVIESTQEKSPWPINENVIDSFSDKSSTVVLISTRVFNQF